MKELALRVAMLGGVTLLASLPSMMPGKSAFSQEGPALSIQKERVSSSTTTIGSAVRFRITVTNSGGVNLTNIAVTDSYPDEVSFVSASLLPTFGPDSGLVDWDFIDADDDGNVDVLEPGDTLTITTEFRAIATGNGVQNCALTFGNVEGGDVDNPEAFTEFDCVAVTIQGGSSSNPSATPTDEAERAEPTPVNTVAAATAVAATAVGPTPPSGVVITAPDTGSGPAAGERSAPEFLSGLAGAALLLSGAGLVAVKRRR